MKIDSSFGHRALRRHRHSIEGTTYLLTAVTIDRRPIFNDWDTAVAAAATLADPGLWRDSKLLCWVLMPDHLHALVTLGDSEPLAKLMKRVKSVVAQVVNRQLNRNGSLWAPAFHDRALRHEDDLVDMARYIIANPVRAGLSPRVGMYPFWDAIWLPG